MYIYIYIYIYIHKKKQADALSACKKHRKHTEGRAPTLPDPPTDRPTPRLTTYRLMRHDDRGISTTTYTATEPQARQRQRRRQRERGLLESRACD